ncbi:glycan-binding surface protein [Proteiniphilum sp.]|uniref:glycan-binding surface protein n=1 Tax=Proteiniphilum sp. TaxID=1926877 RepID=UPI002B208253|nr:glycan-binding surface protein [Proteiniphilum sp.]MEA4917992.1 glycan-binding surface protein [Proteiniphilum sp.]
MKNKINRLLLLIFTASIFASCDREVSGKYEMTDGTPTVYYVRYQAKENAEQLLDGAFMGENIVIIGENLTSVQEVWFNNVKSLLNVNFITKNTLFVNVPKDLPSIRTDKLYLVTAKKDTVAYDFEVKIPAPILSRIKCEQVPEGGEVVLYGDYFLATDASLINVFIGDYKVPTSDIVSFEKNKIVFKSPAKEIKGPVEVKTLYGNSGRSKDIFHDDRGLITGFEEGYVGGWGRPDQSKIQNDPELSISGNYVRIDGTTIGIDGAWVGGSVIINIWGEDNGVPTGNLFPSDPATSTLKFEVNVLEPWSAGPMIFSFFRQGQFEDYLWADGNASGGGMPRGVWVPWLDSGSYISEGWETISIPLSEFKYNGAGAVIPLSTHFGALGIAIHNRGNDAWIGTAECTPVILLDNIRVIP